MIISKKRVAAVLIVVLSQAVLFGLKVGKIIDWSWTWVLAPMWISYICAILIFTAVTAAAVIYHAVERIKHGDKLFKREEPGRDVQEDDSGKD